MAYATRKDAEQALDSLVATGELTKHSGGWSPAAGYVLNYGESSSPDYVPVRRKGGWEIKKTHSYLAGTLNAPKDHIVVICGDSDGRHWLEPKDF